jgi:hypothetical protein
LPRYALLINPFYPKDSHASFGKHVLTPSLALTSVAGATPAHWRVKYWDENLLQGPPPHEPFPQIVAMTVHLRLRSGLMNWPGGSETAARKLSSADCTCCLVPMK